MKNDKTGRKIQWKVEMKQGRQDERKGGMMTVAKKDK
jgi:hypothetical protein